MAESDKRYIFPKWSNKVPTIILVGLVSVVILITYIIWYWCSPKNLNVGYTPTQPIPYSHKLHAGELGIDCRYCHVNVDKGEKAGIPPTEICMNCHNAQKAGIKTSSPHIQQLNISYTENKPMEWVKVHMLPDYAYFNHSRHVNSGVSCVECHGRVDKMEVVHQVKPLSMGWCLDCHRSPESHIRPLSEVTNLGWKAPSAHAQKELAEEIINAHHINPREDCTTCHR